jgi:hypothetical protein
MQVFNAYPLRHPTLQTALGIVLAVAPDAAIEAYVKSIVLYPGLRDDSRQKLIAQARELRTTPKLRCGSSRRGNTDETLWTASQGIPD